MKEIWHYQDKPIIYKADYFFFQNNFHVHVDVLRKIRINQNVRNHIMSVPFSTHIRYIIRNFADNGPVIFGVSFHKRRFSNICNFVPFYKRLLTRSHSQFKGAS